MLVETKAKVGVFAIALGAYLPQFPTLVPEFEAQYDAFKKTIPDTVEMIDGGIVTTKELSMEAGDKFRAADVDLVFDVRFLPNPYYEDELRPLTGMDESVFNYVMDNETARIFANKLEDMVEFLIPKYAQEGKTSLVIAVGCTGGKHRSVTIARELYSRIARNGEYGFRLEHRDVDKDRLLKK